MPTVAALSGHGGWVPSSPNLRVQSRWRSRGHVTPSVHTVLAGYRHPHGYPIWGSGQRLPVGGTPVELVRPSLPLQGAPHAQAARRCGGGGGHGHIHPLGGTVPGKGRGGGVQ